MSTDGRLLIDEQTMTASVPERDLGVDVLMRRPVCVDDSLSVVARIAPLADMNVDLRKDRPCDESGDADERDQAAKHARIMGGACLRRQQGAPQASPDRDVPDVPQGWDVLPAGPSASIDHRFVTGH